MGTSAVAVVGLRKGDRGQEASGNGGRLHVEWCVETTCVVLNTVKEC